MKSAEDHINRNTHSECCDAPMMTGDICSECREHAEAIENEEDAMPTLNADPSKACPLDDCPPGLFFFGGTLGFKTEYRDENGPEAYVVASGEYFWGGTSYADKRRALIVVPAWCEENK